MSRSQIINVALVLLLAAPASAQERFYGSNPSDRGLLTVVGVHDGTAFSVDDLESRTEIQRGELDRFGSQQLDLAGVHHFVVNASAPLLAYFGRDCCGVGGSTFIPTEDGHARVGRAFLLYLPVYGVQSDLVIYAVEASDIVIVDDEGGYVASRSLESGRTWIPYPIVSSTPYVLRSTGDLAVMLSAVNGVASVPPATRPESCDSDVGREFLLNTHSWGTGAVAVFAYEEASVSVEPINGGEPVLSGDLEPDQWLYAHEMGRRSYRITASGDVSVWAGDLEGGENIGDMGDDFSYNLGRSGTDIVLHTANHGATVYASRDDTTVRFNDVEHLLQKDEWLEIEPGMAGRITADRPVSTIVFGGNTLNDWGGFLRPAPRSPLVACPPLDADIPSWPDGGPDGDADADADTQGDADLDFDAPTSDADLLGDGNPDGDVAHAQPRHTCDCRAASVELSVSRLLRAMVFLD